jgi:Flp pilus assembly protein TadG
VCRTRSRDEGGATAVEFALVMTPLLVLIFGIMQYSFYFYSMQGGSDAARFAAREASIGTIVDCSELTAKVRSSLSVVGAGNLTVQRTYDKSSGNVGAGTQIGDDVTVTVTFDSLKFNLPFAPLPNDGKVVSQARTRVDYVPDSTIGGCP